LVLEEVGYHLQRDDPLVHRVRNMVIRDQSRTMLYKRARKDTFWEETLGKTGRHQWHKELRCKMTVTSEEGKDNQQRHQRMKKETGVASGKHEDIT
jgi:hypothetical protein